MARKTHGLSRDARGKKSSQYGRWSHMKQRCYNQKDPGYSNYGGRGIKICDRWLNSFEAFHADMGHPPSQLHSLDRRDNDGDYTPSNCRWATAVEQRNNSRRSAMGNPKRNVTERVARRIRNLIRRGLSTREVASLVGVGKSTVWREGKKLTKPQVKLDYTKIMSIRKAYVTGAYTQQELADLYGVSSASISRVVRHRTWGRYHRGLEISDEQRSY